MDQLLELAERLSRNKVEFVLVGGYAVTAYAGALLTKDLDIACRMAPDNLRRIYDAVADLHPRHRMSPARPPFTEKDVERADWNNLYLATDLGQLDCIGTVAGIGDYEACLLQTRILDLGGFQIRILTLDALIDTKKALNRPRDRHAALELEAIRERQARDKME